jgi:hypothetical protein
MTISDVPELSSIQLEELSLVASELGVDEMKMEAQFNDDSFSQQQVPEPVVQQPKFTKLSPLVFLKNQIIYEDVPAVEDE